MTIKNGTINMKDLDNQISKLSYVMDKANLSVRELDLLSGIEELLCTIEEQIQEHGSILLLRNMLNN